MCRFTAFYNSLQPSLFLSMTEILKILGNVRIYETAQLFYNQVIFICSHHHRTIGPKAKPFTGFK